MLSTHGVDATTKGGCFSPGVGETRVNSNVRAIVNIASKLGMLVAAAIGPTLSLGRASFR